MLREWNNNEMKQVPSAMGDMLLKWNNMPPPPPHIYFLNNPLEEVLSFNLTEEKGGKKNVIAVTSRSGRFRRRSSLQPSLWFISEHEPPQSVRFRRWYLAKVDISRTMTADTEQKAEVEGEDITPKQDGGVRKVIMYSCKDVTSRQWKLVCKSLKGIFFFFLFETDTN